MKNKQYTISHPSKLNSLSTLPLYRKQGLGTLVLSDSFNHPERDNWQKELNKNYYACGCDTGAKWLVSGLILFGVCSAYFYKANNWNLVTSIIFWIGGAIVLSGIGKFYGLLKANSKLKQTIHKIKSNWNVAHVTKTDIICG